MKAVSASKNGKSFKVWGGNSATGLNQATIAKEAGLTFAALTTTALVSIVAA